MCHHCSGLVVRDVVEITREREGAPLNEVTSQNGSFGPHPGGWVTSRSKQCSRVHYGHWVWCKGPRFVRSRVPVC